MTSPTTLAPFVLACIPAGDLRHQLIDVSVLTDVQVLYDWNEPALAVYRGRICWQASAPIAGVMAAVLAGLTALTWDPINGRTIAVTPLAECAPSLPPLEAPLPPCLPPALVLR